MLTYKRNSDTADETVFDINIYGDGTSTTITVDMKKTPIGFKFLHNLPVALQSVVVTSVGGTITLNTDPTKLDITLNSAPASGSPVAASCILTYNA